MFLGITLAYDPIESAFAKYTVRDLYDAKGGMKFRLVIVGVNGALPLVLREYRDTSGQQSFITYHGILREDMSALLGHVLGVYKATPDGGHQVWTNTPYDAETKTSIEYYDSKSKLAMRNLVLKMKDPAKATDPRAGITTTTSHPARKRTIYQGDAIASEILFFEMADIIYHKVDYGNGKMTAMNDCAYRHDRLEIESEYYDGSGKIFLKRKYVVRKGLLADVYKNDEWTYHSDNPAQKPHPSYYYDDFFIDLFIEAPNTVQPISVVKNGESYSLPVFLNNDRKSYDGNYIPGVNEYKIRGARMLEMKSFMSEYYGTNAFFNWPLVFSWQLPVMGEQHIYIEGKKFGDWLSRDW